MDNKTIFVRTSKGEAEISGKAAELYSAIKRVLMMVDGRATFGEISKRAAPSLRNSLEDMFRELEQGGFIHDKAKAANIPRMAVPKMAVPQKTAPQKNKPADESGGELDFMADFFASTPAQLVAEAAKSEKHMTEELAKSRQKPDGAKLMSQQEAEAILNKAKQDAVRIRGEAERAKQQAAAEIAGREESARRAGEEAEAVRKKAQQEAEQLQKELEANRRKAEQEARARVEAETRSSLEAAARAKEQAEADRLKAAQEALIAHEAAERVAKLEREAAKARLEEAARAAQQAEAERKKAEQEAAQAKETAERIAKLEREAADARAEAERLAKQRAQETSPAPEIKPASEIKLDPFFVFDPFKLPGSTPVAPKVAAPEPPKEMPPPLPDNAVEEYEPEIKLDPSIFDAPKAATPPSVAVNKPNMEQVRQAEEQRIAAEAQARKLAEDQAKDRARERARAEAEQREAEAAKARAQLAFEKTLPPTAKSRFAEKPAAYRTSRGPFPWGKLVIFLLVLAAGALFIVPYVLPMRDYVPKVEQALSAKLQQPVHIGQLSGRILPTPRLELGEVEIGGLKQLQVKQAQLDFSIFGLFSEAKPIDNIELQGVKVTGQGLLAVTGWLQQIAADNQYPVRRMTISQGALDADAVQFTGMDGELNFDQAGKFTKANLRASAGKISLSINAVPESKPQIALTMLSSALPLLPSWSFDELTAKGELGSGGLKITEYDGRIAGGILQGGANIDWRSGWRAQGTLVAKTIIMERLSKGLTGDLDGSGRFSMQGMNLSSLADFASMEGTFVIKRGVVTGIDIVETARSRSKESVPGGRTHFDELSGVLTAEKDSYSIRQLKMDAGALIVTGTLDIEKQKLSGKISADLSKWAEMGKVTLQVTGTTDNPSLRAVR